MWKKFKAAIGYPEAGRPSDLGRLEYLLLGDLDMISGSVRLIALILAFVVVFGTIFYFAGRTA